MLRIEDAASWTSINGFTDSPAAASAEAGRAYLDLIIPAVADAYVEMAEALARVTNG